MAQLDALQVNLSDLSTLAIPPELKRAVEEAAKRSAKRMIWEWYRELADDVLIDRKVGFWKISIPIRIRWRDIPGLRQAIERLAGPESLATA